MVVLVLVADNEVTILPERVHLIYPGACALLLPDWPAIGQPLFDWSICTSVAFFLVVHS